MAHVLRNRGRLRNRLRRIRGQVEAVERALDGQTEDCGEVLRLIAACRGAMNALMAEVLEGHVRHHVLDPGRTPSRQEIRGAAEVVDIVRRYLR